jgi:putative ABC transport system permease protein
MKSPGHTAISVVALSLGIGLTTTMFGVVYGAFLRGLPFPGSERLMRLSTRNIGAGNELLPVPLLDFLDWREEQSSYEGLAAWYGSSINVSGSGQRPEQYNGAFVTANFFDVVGVQPALGRGFHGGEDAPSAAPVVVISDTLWRRRFQEAPNILGQTMRVEGQEMDIVGVMPEGFGFPLRQAIWVPLRAEAGAMVRGADMPVQVFGRLKAGVTRVHALAELNAIARRLARLYPKTNQGIGASVTPYVEGYTEEMRPSLYTMLGAVFGVLLIACVNVATLLLVRTAQRSSEVALRTALGAGRSRLIVQFLSEAMLLAACGAALGLALAHAGINLYVYFMGGTLPSFWMNVRLSPVVFLFALGLAVLSSLLSGALPALQVSRTNANDILKDQSLGTVSHLRLGRLSRLLVITEITLSCALLVATGLLVKSVVNLQRVDLGFFPDNVFTARLSLPYSRYPDTASRLHFSDELLRHLEPIPGTASLALMSRLPGDLSFPSSIELEGVSSSSGAESLKVSTLTVTPGFFQTLRVRVLQGRSFSPADRQGSVPVTVVSRSFAELHFPGQSPLGRRLRVVRPAKGPWFTIVGVVPDLLVGEIAKTDRATLFVPLAQNPVAWLGLAIRTQRSPLGLTSSVAREVAKLDADLPIFDPDTLEQKIAGQTFPYKAMSTLFTIMGLVALFLATLGLYGVMAFTVTRKTPEIGLRMALGARKGDILRLVFRSGFIQLGVGVILGLAIAGGLTRFLKGFLFGVEAWDFTIFTVVGVAIMVTGFLACLLPARRASRIDPIVALRNE